MVISTSVMVLLLNVIPNITINVGALMHVVKCTSGGFVQTLLNSSEVLIRTKEDIVKQTITWKIFSFETRLNEFDDVTQINISEVKNRFNSMSMQIKMDFSQTNDLLKECKLVSNRIIAAIFIIYLIVESTCYLNSYLTSVKFDNVYLTKEFMLKAFNNRVHITATKNMVNSTGCKITKQEFSKCLRSIVVVSLYFTAVVFIITLDHIVYYLVTKIGPWLLDIPSTSLSMDVNYKVQLPFDGFCLFPLTCGVTEFSKAYKVSLSPESFLCDTDLSPPDLGVRVLLGLLFLLSYTMVFLEIYARRIRRAITASFYRKQEEERMNFLLKEIQEKQGNDDKDLFYITTTGLAVL